MNPQLYQRPHRLSMFDKCSTQKISKNTVELNSTINHPEIIDIWGTLHLLAEYSFFSSFHWTKIDQILWGKIYYTKFKRLETMEGISQITVEFSWKSTREMQPRIPKYLEIKEYISHIAGTNLKKNSKIFWTKLNWKWNMSNLRNVQGKLHDWLNCVRKEINNLDSQINNQSFYILGDHARRWK